MTFPQEGAEKQAQLERSLREKAAVEKELEKVRKTETASNPLCCTLFLFFAFIVIVMCYFFTV